MMSQAQCRFPVLAAIILLAVATLACAFLGSGSRSARDRVVIFTRLPTLTPTAISAPSIAAMPAETGDASSALAPSSTIIPPTQAMPLLAESAVTASPPAAPVVTPASSDTSGNPGNSSPTVTTLVGLNVRAGPGLDYPVIGQLAQGQSVQIIGKNPEGSWWQIAYPPGSSSPAWVSGDAQYSTVNNAGEVQIVQLPPPPPPAAPPTAAAVAQLPLTPGPADAPAGQPPPASAPTGAPAAQLTPTSALTSNPTTQPTATPILEASGWAFAGVRLYPDQEEETVLLYGNLINNTGSTQELEAIHGTFYDAQGQAISDGDDIYAYWPVYVVPQGGGVPFEVTVDDIDNAANFDLSAEAEPSSETPRQDFEFSDVNQEIKDDEYCVEGGVRNPGGGLQQYLVIVVVLYDDQNNVINFGEYTEYGPSQVVGDEALDFEICVDPLNQAVARHELGAWGY